MTTRHDFWRYGALVLIALLATGARPSFQTTAAQGAATPPPVLTCDDVAMPGAGRPMGSPMAGMDPRGMPMGTPGAMMGIEFDLVYIDMMIAHHAAIVAMARVAEPLLTDERLREIARAIVATQVPEIAELREYRERFYGSPDPAPMDAGMMGMMGQLMPDIGPMEEMAFQMDAEGQVAAICAADPDLAFIDLTIPHHAMAIASSQIALQQATHPEIRDFAQRVIDAQQLEIEILTQIRAELTGAATPAASPDAAGHVQHHVADQATLLDALRAEGLTAEIAGPLQQPFLQPVSGAIVRLSGGALAATVEIQVYEYADEAAAMADAAQIGPDGNPRTAIVEWIAPPHFYRAGRVIVLYVGADPAVLAVLTALLGPPFAGQ